MIAALCSSPLPMREILVLQKKFNSGSKKGKIQLLDGELKVSGRLLSCAEKLAVDSIAEKVAVSDKLEMEFLLWLSRNSHVKNAIGKFGAKKGGGFFAVLVGSGNKADFAEALEALGAKQIGKISETAADDLEEIEKMALSRISD